MREPSETDLGVGVGVRLASPAEASGVPIPAVRVDVEDEGLVEDAPNQSEELWFWKSDTE